MCSICKSVPCLTGCPNAKRAYSTMKCGECGKKLELGEAYMECDGDVVCFECIDDMSGREIFEYFGYKAHSAFEKEDEGNYDGNYRD